MVHWTMVDFFMGVGSAKGDVMYMTTARALSLAVVSHAEVKITRSSAVCEQMRTHSILTSLNAFRRSSRRRAARQK